MHTNSVSSKALRFGDVRDVLRQLTSNPSRGLCPLGFTASTMVPCAPVKAAPPMGGHRPAVDAAGRSGKRPGLWDQLCERE